MDYTGYFRRIMNMDVNETFDQTTDSLEAIAAALGIGPGVGLWMFGIVDATQVASAITIITNNLQNVPNDALENQFWMQVVHNDSAPATAPEGEIRRITNFVQGGALQTFTTDAFTADVEAGDFVVIFHESLLSHQILGRGTLTLSSATIPEDNLRVEVDNYFNGCRLMPTEGACRFQPRRIVDWAVGGGGAGTGVFTLDPNNPLTGVPGLVDYVILGDQTEFVPAADGANNRTPSDTIGSKASTAVYAKDAVSDIIRYLKGLMDASITAWGTADAGSGAGLIRDAARAEVDDWWNGQTVLMLTGAAAFQKRPITDFIAGTDDIIVAPNFDAAVAAGDIYVILAHYNMIVPRAADDVANALTSQVIGRKDDTALYAAAANATLMRYVKGLITAGIAVPGAVSDVGPAITDFDTTLTEATDDHYNGMVLMFIDGDNAGQAHVIDDYGGGARNVIFAAGDRWTDVPGDGDNFVILPSGVLRILAIIGTPAGASVSADIAVIDTLVDVQVMGRAQIAATTIDLNQAAASYDLFTGTTQVVILESLNIKMPTGAAGGALTSISIQTDDATPGVIISAADGAVANLISEAELGWTGTLYIKVGTKIRLTIAGGAHGVGYVCNVTAKYRAVVSGGNLA